MFYLAENSGNLGHRSEAECLAESETHGIGRFEFLFGMVIWYDFLYVVNTVSKSLQSEDMDLEAAIIQLGGLVGSLKGYRETGIEKAKAEAMQIAIDMEIEPAFSSKPKRVIKKKKHFGEDAELQINLVRSVLVCRIRVNHVHFPFSHISICFM